MTVENKLKIGINGFGRIGRAIFRINLERQLFDIVAINDINPDNDNLAYMLKYDSTYGSLPIAIEGFGGGIRVAGKDIHVYHSVVFTDIPWEELGVSIIIDASGVAKNVQHAGELKKRNIRCIVTHSPAKEAVEKHIIMGVNEHELSEDHFVIASSICDSTAFAPVINVLHRNFGIEMGSLTTLHPWLAYQNLVCGPSRSFSAPGSIYRKFALGRASPGTIIPKQTSGITASEKVLGFLKGKFMSHSFRVPTSIVSCANLTVKLLTPTTTEEVIELFKQEAANQTLPIFYNNFEPLVSTDYTKSSYSANIDHEFTEILNGVNLKMVIFYDNEWGYSSRVVDLITYFEQLLHS